MEFELMATFAGLQHSDPVADTINAVKEKNNLPLHGLQFNCWGPGCRANVSHLQHRKPRWEEWLNWMKWWWPSSSSPWHFTSVTGIKPIKVSFSLSKAALMPPDRLPHHQSTRLDQMHQYLSDTMIYIWMGTGTVNKITMMRINNEKYEHMSVFGFSFQDTLYHWKVDQVKSIKNKHWKYTVYTYFCLCRSKITMALCLCQAIDLKKLYPPILAPDYLVICISNHFFFISVYLSRRNC